MTEHPSQYALDRAALGAPITPDLAEHLLGCPSCAAAASRLRAREASPPWLEGVRVGAPAPRRGRRWRWAIPLAAALAASVPLALRTGAGAPEPTLGATREKGVPAVVVYVKRGEVVTAWDGRAPLLPGDRLRIGVRAGPYAQLSVASLPSHGNPTLLYAGPLAPRGETLLPVSFRVDADGSAEVLSVIASDAPVGLPAHTEPPGRSSDGRAWRARLELPKETHR